MPLAREGLGGQLEGGQLFIRDFLARLIRVLLQQGPHR